MQDCTLLKKALKVQLWLIYVIQFFTRHRVIIASGKLSLSTELVDKILLRIQ